MGVYQGTAGAVGIGFVSDVAQILVDIVDPGTSLVALKPRSGRVSPKGSTTPEGNEEIWEARFILGLHKMNLFFL